MGTRQVVHRAPKRSTFELRSFPVDFLYCQTVLLYISHGTQAVVVGQSLPDQPGSDGN